MTEKLAALRARDSMDFWGNSEPKCPHCGSDLDISEHEAWNLYSEDGPHEVECPSCDLTYQVSSVASWTFSTDEQDGCDD